VQHQHLTRALRTRADADGGNAQLLRHVCGEQRGDCFHHDELRARVLHGERVAQQLVRARFGLALHLEAPERVHRLRRKAHVRAHRHRPIDQKTHRFAQPFAAFQLHHLRAGPHQLHGALERGGRRAVAAERHVGDDQRRGLCARHAGGVIRDVLERDGQRGGVSLQHVAERIADEQHVHACTVQQRREACVVARQHGDLLASLAHGLQFRNGHGRPARFLQIGHQTVRLKRERRVRAI
jgi:hypothetical protein